MVVHTIRVVAALDSTDATGLSTSEINAAMDDWVANHSEWTADTDEHVITATTDASPPYYIGTYRFELSDAKDNLLQKCGDKLKNKIDWYRLGYHVCEHDVADPTPCQWEDDREWTSTNTPSIPSGVPDFL